MQYQEGKKLVACVPKNSLDEFSEAVLITEIRRLWHVCQVAFNHGFLLTKVLWQELPNLFSALNGNTVLV